jgi:hypothetical protein
MVMDEHLFFSFVWRVAPDPPVVVSGDALCRAEGMAATVPATATAAQ